MSIDLTAYFERIQYTGSRAPTLETLHAITAKHVMAIPFENLDVLLKRPISLEPKALMQKLVYDQRGGYCFEQNGLLLLVLEALGFNVKPLSARVRIDRPREMTPPRTHVFVRIEIDGASYLADVGVGGLSLTSAIPLDFSGKELTTPHETRRLVQEGARVFHQVKFGDEWRDVCEFTLEEMPPIDRELANWFTSAHPQSHFKNRLMVARAAADGVRLSLLNREFTKRRGAIVLEKCEINSTQELLALLAREFNLALPKETHFGLPDVLWEK